MNSIYKYYTKFTLVFMYAIIGMLWIMLSDDILFYFVKDIEKLSTYQSYKGWAFVTLTTVLLYILLLLYEKRIQATLQSKGQTERKFSLLYKDSPNPYQSLDSNGNILAVNKKWLDLLGYEEQEVLGHPFTKVLAPTFVTYYKNNFSKFKDNGNIKNVEFEMLHKNGSTVPILLHGQIDYDSNHTMIQTHCSLEDISSRHQIEHLNGVLSVIRDVNQLIVREKEVKKMLQESCNILTSNHVYGHTWIMILNDEHQIEHMIGSDSSENFELFKEKVKKGWTPNCINKMDEKFSYIQNTNQVCIGCPLKDMYSGKGAFNIELKYNNKLYGYLNIAVDKKYFSDDTELSLLDEVAGDIAYALYNIKIENSIIELKELYSNTINSVENLIFVKDINFVYITCNSSFERFLGKSKDEIIGKNDYELFTEDIANSFRKYDEQMLLDKNTKFNYEWLIYPNGKKLYYLTTKSPLIDSTGKVIGLVGNSVDFTEQEHLHKLLEDAQRQSKLGSWEQTFDKELLTWSNEVYNIFEYDIKDNMTYSKFVERVHPEDRIDISTVFSTSIKNHSKFYVEYRLLFTDGRVKYVVERAEHFYDNNSKHIRTLGTIQDVTEKQENLREIEQKKLEFETIIQEAPNPIMLHDEDGNVLLVNKIWLKITKYKFSDIDTIDKWTQNAYGVESENVKEYINSLYDLNGRVDECEFVVNTKDKVKRIWQFSSAPFVIINGKKTAISSAMDITELKEKDRVLLQQSKMAAMGEMLGNIAHQWRQPLSTISTASTGIKLQKQMNILSDNQLISALTSINNSAQYLSSTIDDFRDFFNPSNKVSLFKIADTFTKTLKLVHPQFIAKDIEIIENIENFEVSSIENELIQVLINILNNARDGLLRKENQRRLIFINTYINDNSIIIEIKDNAKGIPENIIDRIFEPYFTTKHKSQGTGIGLYMSEEIVKKHLHGIINVENITYNYDGVQYSGAKFTIKLPKLS